MSGKLNPDLLENLIKVLSIYDYVLIKVYFYIINKHFAR